MGDSPPILTKVGTEITFEVCEFGPPLDPQCRAGSPPSPSLAVGDSGLNPLSPEVNNGCGGKERGCLRVLRGRKAAYSREWMDRLAECICNSWNGGGKKGGACIFGGVPKSSSWPSHLYIRPNLGNSCSGCHGLGFLEINGPRKAVSNRRGKILKRQIDLFSPLNFSFPPYKFTNNYNTFYFSDASFFSIFFAMALEGPSMTLFQQEMNCF
jgi:hypothetical protein